MKKITIIGILVLLALLLTFSLTLASQTVNQTQGAGKNLTKKNTCTTIKSGELYASDGSLIRIGFNDWGYNYQGRLYNGMYCDYHPLYRPGGASHEWCIENYGDDWLQMKWNDAWLSNKDCDGDGLLDRHNGYESYIGSGAWLTNHQSGEYEQDGEVCKWNYFVKIVAAPDDAYSENDIWYNSKGAEIGPVIWGSFAIIQQVENDKCAGLHGLQYSSPDRNGLGGW